MDHKKLDSKNFSTVTPLSKLYNCLYFSTLDGLDLDTIMGLSKTVVFWLFVEHHFRGTSFMSECMKFDNLQNTKHKSHNKYSN